jgi:hypothetical protein
MRNQLEYLIAEKLSYFINIFIIDNVMYKPKYRSFVSAAAAAAAVCERKSRLIRGAL